MGRSGGGARLRVTPVAHAGKQRRRLGAGLCGVALAAAVVIRLLVQGPEGDEPGSTPPPRPGGVDSRAAADADGGTPPPQPLRAAGSSWELEPAEVLGDPDCGIAAGWGMPAGDVALVVVPGGEGEATGARFAVLDEHGTLFGGELPFRPNHWRLGRRDDGGVVTAFGDLRLNSKVSRPESGEPLRIYLDAGLVYESGKAWDFGVARDGSSFFVVEPLAGQASRLVIRDLNLGTETHHDLGPELNPFTAAESPYGTSYTRDAAEVAFWPPQQRDGVFGDYWFYPVGGGGPRVVRAVPVGSGAPRPQGGAADAADPRMVRVERVGGRTWERLVFDSSEVVYHIADRSPTWRTTGPFEVVKYAYSGYGGEAGPQRSEVWRQTVPMNIASWSRAPGGPWLAVGDGGRRVLALDTSTGELALAFPTAEDATSRVPERLWRRKAPGADGMNYRQWAWASETLAALRGVLGPDATVADMGRLEGFWFEDGNRLLLSWSVGDYPDLRRFHDVFEMGSVEVDGGPAFRLEKDEMRCGLGGLRGLDVRGGRLVYPGRRAAPTSDRAWGATGPVADDQTL